MFNILIWLSRRPRPRCRRCTAVRGWSSRRPSGTTGYRRSSARRSTRRRRPPRLNPSEARNRSKRDPSGRRSFRCRPSRSSASGAARRGSGRWPGTGCSRGPAWTSLLRWPPVCRSFWCGSIATACDVSQPRSGKTVRLFVPIGTDVKVLILQKEIILCRTQIISIILFWRPPPLPNRLMGYQCKWTIPFQDAVLH